MNDLRCQVNQRSNPSSSLNYHEFKSCSWDIHDLYRVLIGQSWLARCCQFLCWGSICFKIWAFYVIDPPYIHVYIPSIWELTDVYRPPESNRYKNKPVYFIWQFTNGVNHLIFGINVGYGRFFLSSRLVFFLNLVSTLLFLLFSKFGHACDWFVFCHSVFIDTSSSSFIYIFSK